MSVTEFYADWAGYNRRITDALRALGPEDLGLRVAGSDHWPIWAIAGHVAVNRVYWLCDVAGEPGIETTPFLPAGIRGEDDLDTPRAADELVHAFESTWRIVAATLDRWTPSMLAESFERESAAGRQRHSRESILLRMINHEAYHVGEINLTLGASGRPTIDLWPGEAWLVKPTGET